MATASVTLALNQSTFLAGIARAQGAVRGLGDSVGRIGSRGFLIAGTAAVAFGTAAAIGIKKAFDLGGRLADMSAISGRSAKEILLLRRALEDAGVSMEKIDRFILTGQDRGQVIARALQNISSGDWADAARSVGKQADILSKNAATFDRVSDLLGRAGDKLQGFFVGAAGRIANALLPLLEKFDKLDFADQGAKFGAGLLLGAQALVGFFQKPETLFKAFEDGFTAVILGIGNLMAAVFKKALDVLQAGAQAAFENILNPKEALLDFQIAAKTVTRDLKDKIFPGLGDASQRDIDELNAQKAALPKQTSFSDRMLELANQNPLEVADVFHAKEALANAQSGITQAATLGRKFLPSEMGATPRGPKGSPGFDNTTVSAASFGIDESLFSKKSMASDAEFASRWGETPAAAPKSVSKGDQILQKLLEQSQKQTDITEKAFLD